MVRELQLEVPGQAHLHVQFPSVSQHLLPSFLFQKAQQPVMSSGSRTDVWNPSKFGMDKYEEEFLTAPDGVQLHSYAILQGADTGEEAERAPQCPTILMLHANAGNMGHRLPLAKVFHRKLKMNVVMISYRGYGKSEGEAQEKGIRQDARKSCQS